MHITKQPIIQIRWPNNEDGGWFRVPGLSVSQSVALAVFEHQLEAYLVKPTTDPNEYDLLFASSPIFYVGEDLPKILHDLTQLTVAEFAAAYTHSDHVSEGGLKGDVK